MSKNEIGTFEPKAHLSSILSKVQRGQVFYITRHGKRIAETDHFTAAMA